VTGAVARQIAEARGERRRIAARARLAARDARRPVAACDTHADEIRRAAAAHRYGGDADGRAGIAGVPLVVAQTSESGRAARLAVARRSSAGAGVDQRVRRHAGVRGYARVRRRAGRACAKLRLADQLRQRRIDGATGALDALRIGAGAIASDRNDHMRDARARAAGPRAVQPVTPAAVGTLLVEEAAAARRDRAREDLAAQIIQRVLGGDDGRERTGRDAAERVDARPRRARVVLDGAGRDVDLHRREEALLRQRRCDAGRLVGLLLAENVDAARRRDDRRLEVVEGQRAAAAPARRARQRRQRRRKCKQGSHCERLSHERPFRQQSQRDPRSR